MLTDNKAPLYPFRDQLIADYTYLNNVWERYRGGDNFTFESLQMENLRFASEMKQKFANFNAEIDEALASSGMNETKVALITLDLDRAIKRNIALYEANKKRYDAFPFDSYVTDRIKQTDKAIDEHTTFLETFRVKTTLKGSDYLREEQDIHSDIQRIKDAREKVYLFSMNWFEAIYEHSTIIADYLARFNALSTEGESDVLQLSLPALGNKIVLLKELGIVDFLLESYPDQLRNRPKNLATILALIMGLDKKDTDNLFASLKNLLNDTPKSPVNPTSLKLVRAELMKVGIKSSATGKRK
jgi:hypothetical protein